MAAANKGSPIQLKDPFPEVAMGPLTQRPGQLTGALGQPSHDACMAVSKQILGGCYWQAVSKHRMCGGYKQQANYYQIVLLISFFYYQGAGPGKERGKKHS